MPNKLLLPMVRNHRPIICSAVEYALRSECDVIRVLIQPDDFVLENILRQVVPVDKLEIVYQELASGVLDAVRAVHHPEDTHTMILCGDNVYPTNEFQTFFPSWSEAICRLVSIEEAFHLVKWDEDRREYTRMGQSIRALTTPWVLSDKFFKDLSATCDFPPDSVAEAFTALGVRPAMREKGGWYDVGTPETYRRYWREEN